MRFWAEDAAEALKPIPKDLVEVGICDEIILEPSGGAHREFLLSANSLKKSILKNLEKLLKVKPESFLDNYIKLMAKTTRISSSIPHQYVNK